MIAIDENIKDLLHEPIIQMQLSAEVISGSQNTVIDLMSGADVLVDVKISAQSKYFSSSMKRLEMSIIGIDHQLNTDDTWLKIKCGIINGNNLQQYNIGTFKVTECTIDKEKSITKVVGYDSMINFMQQYNSENIIYPKTLKELVQAICSKVNINTSIEDFEINNNFEIHRDIFDGIADLTYRDVLDYICQVTGTYAIISEDNELIFKSYEKSPAEVLTYNDLISFKFQESCRPVNSIVFSRTPQEDNIYERDEQSVLEDGLCELKFENNLIADGNRSMFAINLLNELNGFKFYPCELSTVGLGYFQIGDLIQVIDDNDNAYSFYITSYELNFNGGFTEKLISNRLDDNNTKYQYASKTEKRMTRTELIVDKQSNEISSIVEQIGDRIDKTTSITQDIDGINSKVTEYVNLIETVTGDNYVFLENCAIGPLVELHIYGNNQVFGALYPQIDLYPQDTLYPLGSSCIKITNNDSEKIIDLQITEVLRSHGNVCDEFVYDMSGARIIRRVNQDGTVKDTEEIVELEELTEIIKPLLLLEEGINKIEVLYYNVYIKASYAIKNYYTNNFASRIEMESRIKQTSEEIESVVSKKIDEDELISKINQSAEQITLSGNRVVIDSNNFKLDKNGNVTCNNATMNKISISDVELRGNNISIIPNLDNYLKVGKETDSEFMDLWGAGLYVAHHTPGYEAYDFLIELIGYNDYRNDSHISINGESSSAYMNCYGVHTSSLAELKQDFEKFENALDIINNTDIYKFYYKGDKAGQKKHIGIVIGNDYKCDSELISDDGKMANWNNITATCFEAIKEQQKQIELLQKQIELLQKQIEVLENKINGEN